MKLLKNIFAWIMIILLGIVYMIDRVILVFLPWMSVYSIQDWMPKNTDTEQIKKEFTFMSDEAIQEVSEHRQLMIHAVKMSGLRVCISVFIEMCVYIIFR